MQKDPVMKSDLPRYDPQRSYAWNYDHAPDPVEFNAATVPGDWTFCGISVGSPLGIPAGPLLNGRWILYYASLGFDVLTYKTVRSTFRTCYEPPNLQPVACAQLDGSESELKAADRMTGSWAVSFGMPSNDPDVWRKDIEQTRARLPDGKVLSVSVVGTVQNGWTTDDLASDYAQCARWAVDAGADCVETNFSCPNVSTCDGQLFQNPAQAGVISQAVRERIGGVPFIVKVGHVTRRGDAEGLLNALVPNVTAIALTNSVATKVRGKRDELLFDGQPRGICGEGILDASIQQTRLFADVMKERGLPLELIGVGGVRHANDVRRYLEAGAHAVHLATSAMVNPGVGLEIRSELTEP